ncbi:6-bladed beta-propeller [Gracilimonas sp.]|uniref:6-bladed beta-propeller n=1 Tax=Gracilimonas sp. TaxID=1974203 RepID=UPI002871AF7C|nr:6-bladed beta-propeller [Gracilimonas sp.]
MKLILAFLITMGLGICNAQPSIIFKGISNNLKLVKNKTIELDENLMPFGRAYDICSLPNSNNFVLITDQQTSSVIKYSPDGLQMQIIGKKGRGPFEYERPVKLFCDVDAIYFREGVSSKYLSFDSNGNGLWEKIAFPIAPGKFIIDDNSLVLIHFVPQLHKDYLKIFDIDSEEQIKSFGFTNNIDPLLGIYNGSGGLTKHFDRIYFARPSDTKLYYLQDESVDSVEFTDPEFEVKKTNLTQDSDWNKVVDYISSNSRVSGLFPLSNYLIAQTEHGTVEEDRYSKLFVFNKDHTLLDEITVPPKSQLYYQQNFMKFSGNGFLYSFYEQGNQKFITEWAIESIEN